MPPAFSRRACPTHSPRHLPVQLQCSLKPDCCGPGLHCEHEVAAWCLPSLTVDLAWPGDQMILVLCYWQCTYCCLEKAAWGLLQSGDACWKQLIAWTSFLPNSASLLILIQKLSSYAIPELGNISPIMTNLCRQLFNMPRSWRPKLVAIAVGPEFKPKFVCIMIRDSLMRKHGS